jgi:hypothetical protein
MMRSQLPPWWQVCPWNSSHWVEVRTFFTTFTQASFPGWLGENDIIRSTGLGAGRVRELIAEYSRLGLLLPHPDQPGLWGYWECVPPGP